MGRGLLLINLGTPTSTHVTDVGRYLFQFLMDKRIIDLPKLIRFILVFCFILPTRTRKSAEAYQSIWTDKGSPLLCLSQNLLIEIQKQLASTHKVALGMRYNQPSIASALNQLENCTSITVLPLYPQYSSAATGSSFEEVMRILKEKDVIPSIRLISHFYEHPSYIKAQARLIKPLLGQEDHLLFSYHGIPERQIHKSGCKDICSGPCPAPDTKNLNCYRAQCYQTSLLLAEQLKLNSNQHTTAFQSRLGRIPWARPYMDEILASLAENGVRNLVVVCPSFVTDCLETLEEIGIRARKQWADIGGEKLTLVPCLNADSVWIEAILDIAELKTA